MDYFALPEVPEDQQSGAQVEVRYEDINQHGRPLLTALPHALGETVWRGCLDRAPRARAWRRQGVVPIMSRVVVESDPGPFSPVRPMAARGRYQLAHVLADGAGSDGTSPPPVDRLVLNVWAELEGRVARFYGAQPPNAGTTARAGRVFAEHTFTRLFAPAGERKVTSLEGGGDPPVPLARYAPPPLSTIAELPAGATPLDDAPALDATAVQFGLSHTDSNQHVNSMAYPRLFEDAALRRLARHGRGSAVMSTRLEIGYRKPCFAGDELRWVLRAFTLGERLGVAGTLVAARDARDDRAAAEARPYCYVRLLFEAA